MHSDLIVIHGFIVNDIFETAIAIIHMIISILSRK